jgi:hypothetical protein
VKTVIHQCLTRYRFRDQAAQQIMGELPSTRVKTSRLFLSTGVDCAGPISLRLGTPCSKTITKGYFAIFVCFVTKAVRNWNRHKLNYWSIPCYPETFHRTTKETKGNIFRQWYQLSTCCKWTSWHLKNASIHITDGKGTGILGHWKMRLEIYSTTWTSEWNPWSNICDEHYVLMLPLTRNCAPYLLR